MKKLYLFAVFFVAQAAVIASAQAEVYITTANGVPVQQPYCREYTQTLKIGNHVQKAYGTACMQPDGSWELMPKTAQAPNITYIMREDRVYYMPPVPLFGLVIGGRGHERHEEHHEERHNEHWHDR